MKAEIERARALLDAASDITVVAHERPDGDAIGSMLGLVGSLRLLGKSATPVLPGGLPRRFAFLPGAGDVQPDIPSAESLLIAVDVADDHRSGLPSGGTQPPAINFDHHATNSHFAEVNLVDPEAAATAELLFLLAPELGLPMDSDVATNLLTGLITDTIGFRTKSVRPQSLEVAARLMELGADLPAIYARALVQRSYVAVRYWGQGLVKLDRRDGLVWASLTRDDRRQAGYPGADDADLIDILTTIEDAEIALVFIEQTADRVKISWRARGDHDVARVAGEFGGGGHRQASGAIVEGSMDEVIEQVVDTTYALLGEPARGGR